MRVDIVIFGGGVAGLWLLNLLSQRGYQCLLFEKSHLGGEQSLASQGIIHGGTKYSLQGELSQATQAIAAMPKRWQRCLSGQGELDLSHTQILAKHQHMWSSQSLMGKLTNFFASKSLRGQINRLSPEHYPEVFRSADFKGQLYELNEYVLDVPSLINNLIAPVQDKILPLREGPLQPKNLGAQGWQLEIPGLGHLQCQQLIACAGQGNGELAQQFGLKLTDMQIRPLQMLLVRSRQPLPKLYGHCIGANPKPLLTVTSHVDNNQQSIWYLGGDLAEKGAQQSTAELIETGQKTLGQLLAWLDYQKLFADAQWASVRLNRAEPLQMGQRRPDQAFCQNKDRFMLCWPTKLALTPALGDQILEQLKLHAIEPLGLPSIARSEIPLPDRAAPLWDRVQWHKPQNSIKNKATL